MKKLAFFFILCIIALSNVLGQDQSVADSLYVVLESNEDDSATFVILKKIIENETDPEKKRSVANELINLAKESNSLFYQHQGYLFKGQSYRIQGDFDLAVEDLIMALKLAEEIQYTSGVVASTTALADTYSTYGDYFSAIEYYRRSIEIMPEKDHSLRAVTLLNLGDTYYMMESYDSALECFEESKKIYDQLGDLSGLAYNLGNIGLVQAEQGQIMEAEKNVAASIRQLEQLGDHYGSCIFLGYMSDFYFKRELMDKAYVFADSCLKIGRRYGLKTEIRDNLLRVSNIYAQKKDFESAFSYHKKYALLKDSISNEEVFSRIEDLESAFALSEKQAEVDLLKAQKKNQQAVIVTATAIVFAFAVMVIVIFIYYRNKIRINRVLKRQKVSLERLNETKDKFFSIISHDLRGPVNSLFGVSQLIRHFVKAKDTDKLLEMANHMETTVERLSSLLDNLLNWAMQQRGHFPNIPEKVELKEMVDEIMTMFSNMASGKQVEVQSNIKQPIHLWVDKNSTHTIIRNLLNNAIKFTEKGGKVEVMVEQKGLFVDVLIKDSGIGIANEKLKKLFSLSDSKSSYGTAGEKGLGVGLSIVKEFVDMNNAKISVESALKKGTTFTVTFPLFEPQEKQQAVQEV